MLHVRYGYVPSTLRYRTVPVPYRTYLRAVPTYSTLPTNKNLRTVPYRTVPYLYLISSYRLSIGIVRYGTVRTYGIVRYVQYHTALYGNDVPYRAEIRELDSHGGTVKYGTVRYRTRTKLFRIVDLKMPIWHHAIKCCIKPELHMQRLRIDILTTKMGTIV